MSTRQVKTCRNNTKHILATALAKQAPPLLEEVLHRKSLLAFEIRSLSSFPFFQEFITNKKLHLWKLIPSQN